MDIEEYQGDVDCCSGEQNRNMLLRKIENLTEAECKALLLILDLVDSGFIFFDS